MTIDLESDPSPPVPPQHLDLRKPERHPNLICSLFGLSLTELFCVASLVVVYIGLTRTTRLSWHTWYIRRDHSGEQVEVYRAHRWLKLV
ncbi:hypothetical protein BDV09DRAFT_65756 [Aspergillus tetrazonus]